MPARRKRMMISSSILLTLSLLEEFELDLLPFGISSQSRSKYTVMYQAAIFWAFL
jgi:hypothetical protein